MPSFNSAQHIEKAIDSVCNQSLGSVELFVVDGGSKDGTRGLVRTIAATDRRVELIENDVDHGPAHARSEGIRRAKGRYIAFLDADDYWLPDKLQRQVSFMDSSGARFSYCRYRTVSGEGTRLGCLIPMRKSYTYFQALGHRGIGTLTVMIERSLLSDDVIRIWRRAGGEEYLWWLLVLRKGVTAHLLDLDLARYRNTPGSLSKNQLYTIRTIWSMYRNELNLPLFPASCYYASYITDVLIRKFRVWQCEALTQAGLRGKVERE